MADSVARSRSTVNSIGTEPFALPACRRLDEREHPLGAAKTNPRGPNQLLARYGGGQKVYSVQSVPAFRSCRSSQPS